MKLNGFGATVISKLIKMGLKKNLYYEIKDVVAEERQDGVHAYKQKIRTKVYGLTSTKAVRQLLIDLLIERSENHKDKFISPIIYNEMLGMEVKRNGKVEHSASTHDDQVFSMLMALYVWYEGTNLSERYGIKKCSIKTDDEVDEILDYYDDETVEVVDSFNQKDEFQDEISKDIDYMIDSGGIQMQEFLEKQRKEEKARLNQIINSPLGEKAYRQMFNIPDNIPLSNFVNQDNKNNIPDSVLLNFYNNENSNPFSEYPHLANVGAVPENQIGLMESDEYNYLDHFNF